MLSSQGSHPEAKKDPWPHHNINFIIVVVLAFCFKENRRNSNY